MSEHENRFYGIYRASVSSTADPTNQRRLRLIVPAVLGPTEPTGWAWPADMSTTYPEVPEVGQGVWVMFEQGIPNNPVWIGSFGNNKAAGSQVKITNLPAGISSEYLEKTGNPIVLDLIATIVTMAQTLEDFQDRIEQLEEDMPTALAS